MSFFGTPFTDEEVEKGSTPLWEQVITMINKYLIRARLLQMKGVAEDFTELSLVDFQQAITTL